MSKYDNLINLIRKDGSIITNKNLIFALGRNPAEIFTELLSKQKYYYNEDKLTDDGYFYCTIDRLYLNTGLKKDAQNTAINILIDKGLIKKDKRDLPQKRYFKVIAAKKQIMKYIKLGVKVRKDKAKELYENKLDDIQRFLDYLEKQAEITDIPKKEDLPKNSKRKNRRIDIGKNSVNNTKVENTNDYTKENTKGNKSIDLISWCNFEIKNPPEIYERNIYHAIGYYLQKYKNIFNKEHPDLKYKTWINVIDSLREIYDESYDRYVSDIDYERYKELIDRHFNTDYQKGCTYEIPHFASNEILKNRYFEVGDFG